MEIGVLDAVKYVLLKMGCLHPFRISRIIALADLKSLEDRSERLTNAVYVEGPGVFYIEGVKELIESDECIEKREGDPARGVKGCLELVCNREIIFPEPVRKYLDEAVNEARGLDDLRLNDVVVSHPLYKKLFS